MFERSRPRCGWCLMLLPMLAASITRGLWAPDEPRYAEVAREAFELRDFVVMHLCGDVYPDKPPLFFLSIGLLGWISDWSVPAMRVVSLAATAATAWLVGRFASRWWGRAEAAWAPAIYLGTIMVTEIGGRLQIDPMLSAFCTAAVYAATNPSDDRKVRGRSLLLAGAFVGLAALAKGPVAFANVGLVVVAWRFALRTESLDRIELRSSLGAALLAVAPVAAWAVYAIAREPILANELLFDQHLGRVTSGARHGGPIWKHLERMPLQLMPWTLPVVLGSVRAVREWTIRGRRPRDEGLQRAFVWLAVLLVFYSLIPSKRDLYLLPAYPAAALIAGRWIVTAGRRHRPGLWPAWSTTALLAAVSVAIAMAGPLLALRAFPRIPDGVSWRAAVLSLPWLAGTVACAWALRDRDLLEWGKRVLGTWCVGCVGAALLVLPPLDEIKSAKALALRVAARPENPRVIPCFGVQPEGYRFYGRIPTVRGVSLSDSLRHDGAETLALVRAEYWSTIEPELAGRLRVLEEEQVGSRRVLVVGAESRKGDLETGTGLD